MQNQVCEKCSHKVNGQIWPNIIVYLAWLKQNYHHFCPACYQELVGEVRAFLRE